MQNTDLQLATFTKVTKHCKKTNKKKSLVFLFVFLFILKKSLVFKTFEEHLEKRNAIPKLSVGRIHWFESVQCL